MYLCSFGCLHGFIAEDYNHKQIATFPASFQHAKTLPFRFTRKPVVVWFICSFKDFLIHVWFKIQNTKINLHMFLTLPHALVQTNWMLVQVTMRRVSFESLRWLQQNFSLLNKPLTIN